MSFRDVTKIEDCFQLDLRIMCDKSHQVCNCASSASNPSVQQTLDELDFTRGIWTAALDGAYEDVVTFLDKKAVDPNVTDSSGYSALHYASRNGHFSVCELLLKHGASPNIQTSSGGVTPLHRAAYCGHTQIVDLLLKRGADPCLSDSDGKLPIHKAAEKGHQSIVEVLLKQAPSSKSVQDNRGRTPQACVPDSCKSLIALLDSG